MLLFCINVTFIVHVILALKIEMEIKSCKLVGEIG